MRRNDLAEAKRLDTKALIEKTKLLRQEIANLVVDKNMSKLKDVKAIFKKRRDLAQCLTILRQKQLVESLESRVKVQDAVEKGAEK